MSIITSSSFKAVTAEFLEYYKSLGQTRSYIMSIDSSLRNYVFPLIGDKVISSITESDIRNVEAHLRQIKSTDTAAEVVLIYVRFVFHYARQQNIIDKDPTDYFRLKRKRRIPTRVLSAEECASLLNAFNQIRLPNLYRFMYFSGMTLNVGVALRISSYNAEAGILSISEEMDLHSPGNPFPRAAQIPRDIELNEQAAMCLKEELSLRTDRKLSESAEDYIFTTTYGTIISTYETRLCNYKIRELSVVTDFKPSHLRENFLLRCVKAGVDDRSIEKYFGIRDPFYMLRIRNQWEGSPYNPILYDWRNLYT